MSMEEDQPDEPLENWLARKPYWEQHIWKCCGEHEALTDDQIAQCYQHLLEDIGVSEIDQNDRPTISLKNAYVKLRTDANVTATIRISEIKDFKNVNALSGRCSFPCSPNLTLIYGRNASGKSGVARLLANACLSRGERAILPDLTVTSPAAEKPAATFMLTDPTGASPQQIDYELGKDHDELRRFSVFDDRSVLIHLDESNNVRFTPPHIAIFDRVADAVARLERRLAHDKATSRKENPFVAMFPDSTEVSATSRFCMGLSAATTDEQLRPHTTFDKQADEKRIAEIERIVAEKRKLDIPAKKTQLANDKANLEALCVLLQAYVDRLSIANSREINKLVDDIVAQRVIVERLGTGSFDDDVLKTTGSDEWRALIKAAKALYNLEKKARADDDPTHCLLCHQALDAKATALYTKYWAYLESEAEGELARLVARQSEVIDAFRLAKARFPKLLDTDTGVQTLAIADPECLNELKTAFVSLETVLDRWAGNIQKGELVDGADVPTIDLPTLTLLADAKTQESIGLVDPAPEIDELTKELVSIKHRKAVSVVKEKAEEYLNYLRWFSKTERVNFPGIKAALTKKRTEQLLLGRRDPQD